MTVLSCRLLRPRVLRYGAPIVVRRDVRLLLALAALAMAWLLARSVAGLGEGLEFLFPALLFALPLLAGRYLGEDLIERVRVVRAVPAPRRLRPRAPQLRAVARAVPRGRALLAAHLAHRPPPAVA
jgi:hypothetical protein